MLKAGYTLSTDADAAEGLLVSEKLDAIQQLMSSIMYSLQV